MNTVRIIRKSRNLELVSKIMNSVAVKYGCRVKYNSEVGRIDFTGDESRKQSIAEETIGLFA